MKPPTFDYFRPRSVAEAVQVLGEHPDAKVLAGGQSLVPMMNMRLARPSVLVDIGRLEGLSGIEVAGTLRVGATTRQETLLGDAAVRRGWPMIAAALRHVGHPATRARGTVGGSVAHGEPAGELPAVMLALDAIFVLEGPSGTRSVAAADFFLGHYTTVLADDELLVRIEIPSAAGLAWGFGEVVRRHGDYALTGVATALHTDAHGVVTDARVALFAVAERPLRSAAAERFLVGTRLGDTDAAAEAGRLALSGIEVAGDSFVSSTYRQEATTSLVCRVLCEATTNPKGDN